MKKIVFFADAIGAAFNCIAIAQECLKYDFHAIFIADYSFSGFFSKYGFEECLVNLHNSNIHNNPAHQWIHHVNSHLSEKLSPFDQIESYIVPLFDKIIESVIYSHEEIQSAINKINPDVICIDDIVGTPAFTRGPYPWVRLISCNEAEIPDPNIPPKFSGYNLNNKEVWSKFENHLNKSLLTLHNKYNHFLLKNHFSALPENSFFEESPYLNLFVFPEIIAHKRKKTLNPNKFHYLNGCIRKEPFYHLPNFGTYDKYPLIYISHGSMGNEDVAFMHKQIQALSYQNCRVLINVGNNLEAYRDLPPNIKVSPFFPQPRVIQLADLIVHHGGNNTFNEVLYYGKPSIVIPYAIDQYDNAALIERFKLGTKLDRFSPYISNLWCIADKLLRNKTLKNGLLKYSGILQKEPGANKASKLISDIL